MQFWDQWEGKSLAGSYPLGSLLRTEGDHAWFATRYRQKPATVYVAKAGKEADQASANLETACRIKHPNIISMERVGRASIDGAAVVYAILEPTEENLAEVLRERALTPDETALITESLVAALGALREKGLLHGRVTTANVFAVGDRVKLRSDCIHKAPGGAKAGPKPYAQDLGDLGALVFESLTRRRLTSPDDPAVATLPAPFRAIVQRAVTGRWGLTDISAALKKFSVEPRHPVPASAKPAGPKHGEDANAKAVAPKAIGPKAVAPNAAGPVVAARSSATAAKRSGVRLFAVTAIVALLAVVLYFYRGAQDATAPAADATTPAAADTTVSPAPAPASTPPEETPADAKGVAAANPAVDQVASQVPSAGDDKQEVWRVVVYAYDLQDEAQKKVDTLLKSHPELQPEVFTANGIGPYLVTVGGPMSKNQALRLRGRVARAGLPADSYAQNYSH
jgi:hypothetical protein